MRDVVIIGGGPAGLTAATYLGRFRRPTQIIDGGTSRARWIPKSRNIPAFAHGIGGPRILARLREQALKFGTTITPGTVESIAAIDGGYALQIASETIESRFIVLASGTVDQLPDLPGTDAAIRAGILKICPVCDAYEAIDRKIAVIGGGAHGVREAAFLRTYSARLTLLHVDGPCDPANRAALNGQGIRVLEVAMSDLTIEQGALTKRASSESAQKESFETAYIALGSSPKNELALRLGARCDANGALILSAHQETSVPGIYAAGDVVRGLNQVVVAAAEAAIATTHIHNRLRRADLP
jgi:thioredoxin reductase (NADPH)